MSSVNFTRARLERVLAFDAAVRTGRKEKRSAQLATVVAAANAEGPEATALDLFPRLGICVERRVRIFGFAFGQVHGYLAQLVRTGSTSTSQPLEVGMPVPSVLPPISLQVGGP